ncbi:MAG: hypothetical protein Q8R55_00740 [Candidatus Taylorbacteria bacterium]|nr:hypothetical protein [Candidatus Taylorbacteria bacterium]
MVLVVKKRKITNDDVQKLLHVSDATATRYLKELVRQDQLKQSNAGRGSVYEPMSSFDNLSIQLEATKFEQEVEKSARELKSGEKR